MNHKILIVEDEPKILSFMCEILGEHGYLVSGATDGDIALNLFKTNEYDLVITDINMPYKDGYSLIKELREKDEHTPILIVTALEEDDDQIKGFELGADDYISKPFSYKILLKRVEALLKNSQAKRTKLVVDNIYIDRENKTVVYNGVEIKLDRIEYILFELLVINYNKVFSSEELQQHIIGQNFILEESIEEYIANIMSKMPKINIIINSSTYCYEKI